MPSLALVKEHSAGIASGPLERTVFEIAGMSRIAIDSGRIHCRNRRHDRQFICGSFAGASLFAIFGRSKIHFTDTNYGKEKGAAAARIELKEIFGVLFAANRVKPTFRLALK